MDIINQLELFQQKRVSYLRNYILNPPRNHNAIISQWARWWIEDTKEEGVERGVFDEATACESGKRADLMFLEKSSGIFKIRGVAEIENKGEKYLEKLETLKEYDDMTVRYPDLKFVILSTIMIIDRNNKTKDYFSPLFEEAKKYSKDSNLSWIIYILRISENCQTPRLCRVPDTSRDPEDYKLDWNYFEYENKGSYVILEKGIEIKNENWPESGDTTNKGEEMPLSDTFECGAANMREPPTFNKEVAKRWIEETNKFLKNKQENPAGKYPEVPTEDFLESFEIEGKLIPRELVNFLSDLRIEVPDFDEPLALGLKILHDDHVMLIPITT